MSVRQAGALYLCVIIFLVAFQFEAIALPIVYGSKSLHITRAEHVPVFQKADHIHITGSFGKIFPLNRELRFHISNRVMKFKRLVGRNRPSIRHDISHGDPDYFLIVGNLFWVDRCRRRAALTQEYAVEVLPHEGRSSAAIHKFMDHVPLENFDYAAHYPHRRLAGLKENVRPLQINQGTLGDGDAFASNSDSLPKPPCLERADYDQAVGQQNNCDVGDVRFAVKVPLYRDWRIIFSVGAAFLFGGMAAIDRHRGWVGGIGVLV